MGRGADLDIKPRFREREVGEGNRAGRIEEEDGAMSLSESCCRPGILSSP